ncbi:MAG: polysaccharide deacetylase family protein [Clostridiaceae bacterium]|nr:polysaccharide deacetylase family protein [Clostridiaceae bacterium]
MILIMNRRFVKMIAIMFLIVIIIAVGTVIIYNRKTTPTTVINHHTISNPIEKGSEESNYIAFACNVDWGNEVIPEMLENLNEKDIKITFFVTGRWAKAFPELLEAIVKEGHEIGSHGYQHLDYSQLSIEKNKEQIRKAEEVIMEQIGIKPNLFAPPSGAYNQHTLIAAEELGYKTILWSIDTIDWRQGSTKDVIVERVMKKSNHNGAIILMHPMPETAKALPTLIEEMNKKGLKVGRISDVLIND